MNSVTCKRQTPQKELDLIGQKQKTLGHCKVVCLHINNEIRKLNFTSLAMALSFSATGRSSFMASTVLLLMGLMIGGLSITGTV